MKTLTVSFFVCALMALTRAAVYTTEPPSHFQIDEFFFPCPDGWTMFNIHCLLYVPTNMNWAAAEENCQHSGGNLASVYDSAASSDISVLLRKAGHQHGKFWVGGSNTAKDPSWSWNDYMGITQFHHFCSGEHQHHCLQISFEKASASGCLDDMDCKALLPSVCAIIRM